MVESSVRESRKIPWMMYSDAGRHRLQKNREIDQLLTDGRHYRLEGPRVTGSRWARSSEKAPVPNRKGQLSGLDERLDKLPGALGLPEEVGQVTT